MDSLVSDINKLVILQIAQMYQVPATKSTFLSIVFQFSSKRPYGLWLVCNCILTPVDAEFVQSEMQPHLVNCLKMGKLSRFPQQSQHSITHSKSKIFNVKMYCMCHTLDNCDENMVQCTNCQGWYHYQCAKMRTKRSVPVNWKCSKCLNGKKQ